MNHELSLSFKITNWCNLNCAHCCEYSGPKEPVKFLSLEKMEKYIIESLIMSIRPSEYLVIGGGEAMAPYMHNMPDYIPKALDIIYKYGYVPVIKTNGTWGNNDETRNRILTDIAKCAYKYNKLITLDISVDEFHNNTDGVSKIIHETLFNQKLCVAIRICLVGFNTKKSEIVVNKLQRNLQEHGIKVRPTFIKDWILETPDGNGVYMPNSFINGIYDLGRAKETKVYTETGNPTGSIDCLQIDNNDVAIYNYVKQEPINNRSLDEVLYSLIYNHTER